MVHTLWSPLKDPCHRLRGCLKGYSIPSRGRYNHAVISFCWVTMVLVDSISLRVHLKQIIRSLTKVVVSTKTGCCCLHKSLFVPRILGTKLSATHAAKIHQDQSSGSPKRMMDTG